MIGKLDRRITIQEPVLVATISGSTITTWEDVCTVWAGREYKVTGSKEDFEADREVATNRVNYTIRYRTGLNEKMRFQDGSDYYDILVIREEGHKSYLKLEAIKRA